MSIIGRPLGTTNLVDPHIKRLITQPFVNSHDKPTIANAMNIIDDAYGGSTIFERRILLSEPDGMLPVALDRTPGCWWVLKLFNALCHGLHLWVSPVE